MAWGSADRPRVVAGNLSQDWTEEFETRGDNERRKQRILWSGISCRIGSTMVKIRVQDLVILAFSILFALFFLTRSIGYPRTTAKEAAAAREKVLLSPRGRLYKGN